MTRVRKIEEALADWFRVNTEFSVGEGVASIYVGGDTSFGSGHSVEIDLTRLAEELDSQFERIGATT